MQIISIMSCKKNLNRQQAIRNTWLKDKPKDFNAFFFVGDPGNPSRIEDDIIYLDTPDDYQHLPIKQFTCLKFLIETFPNLNYTFNCDDDTYVVIDRLKKITPTLYQGYPTKSLDGVYSYAYGGAGFILSNLALNKLKLFENTDIVKIHPWADSLIGLIMHLTNIPLVEDYRFNMGKYNEGRKQTLVNGNLVQFQGEGSPIALPNKENSLITSHFITEDLFYKIYNHFHGNEVIENRYIIKSEFTGVYFSFFERKGEWYYHRGFNKTMFTKENGPFSFLEIAEYEARKEDEIINQKLKQRSS